MRFSAEMYDKVFPREKTVQHVESAVETFKPTEDLDSSESVVETEVVEEDTEGGVDDGRDGESDIEQ